MEIPAQYRGREQAYFKHCLLEAYLERLFMIVGQHQRTYRQLIFNDTARAIGVAQVLQRERWRGQQRLLNSTHFAFLVKKMRFRASP